MLQNAPREHSAILSTFIKLPFVFKTYDLSIFEWLLKTHFTVFVLYFFSMVFVCLIDFIYYVPHNNFSVSL